VGTHVAGRRQTNTGTIALAPDRFAALPLDEEWLVSASLLAETASELADVDCAATLYELLAPFGDRIALSPPEISVGAVARYLGLLAATIGEPDAAERHFRDAIAIHRAIGARTWLERTERDLARCLGG
jgi:hypothetical protein